jgi:hypothetical protein
MRITIEVEFEADCNVSGDDKVTLQALRFPGCKQNLLPYLSKVEQVKAQAELESQVEQLAMATADAIRERREMAGDYRREIAREFQREELASRESQRGFR